LINLIIEEEPGQSRDSLGYELDDRGFESRQELGNFLFIALGYGLDDRRFESQ
jgi:hypothetical protein